MAYHTYDTGLVNKDNMYDSYFASTLYDDGTDISTLGDGTYVYEQGTPVRVGPLAKNDTGEPCVEIIEFNPDGTAGHEVNAGLITELHIVVSGAAITSIQDRIGRVLSVATVAAGWVIMADAKDPTAGGAYYFV